MELFLTIAGFIFIALILIAALYVARGYLVQMQNERYERMAKEIRENTYRDIGMRLLGDAYWFDKSYDDISPMVLMTSLGQCLRNSGNYDISHLRDDALKLSNPTEVQAA